MTIDLAAFLADTIKMATPLIFAALAALLNRHAGMFNMGIEGMILCSALGAATGAHFLGNVWLGLLCGILTGVLTGLFIAFVVVMYVVVIRLIRRESDTDAPVA